MSAHRHKDPNEIPSVIPHLVSRGFGEFLDKTLRQIVVDNKDDIHGIVDQILANHDRKSSKGQALKSSAGGHSSNAPPYIFKEPKVVPASVDIRRSAFMHPVTRSIIEPMHERLNSSTSFQGPFDAALQGCKKAVDEIVAACRKENKKFFDSSFAFDSRANMYPEGSPDDCTVTEPQFAARLQELYPNCVLFQDGAQCDDLKQGGVGDCFLIGALSATAANSPLMIERIFAAHDTVCGVYGVVFYKSGGWEWVIVDDYVAVKKERSGAMYPQYVTPKGTEVWPAVLEKAYAKVHYNWDMIDGGFSREAVVDITGGVDKVIDLYHQDKSMTFKQMMAVVTDPLTIVGCAVGNHVEAGEGTGSSGEEGAVFGLFHGHAYGVINAKVTSDGTGFLQLRNPWGEQEWKGRYSDGSKEWKQNPQHMAEIKPSFGDDGEFWMVWDDFRAYMTTVDVVYAIPPAHKVLTLYMKAMPDFLPASTVMLIVLGATTKFTIVGEQDDPKVKFNSQQHKRQKSDPYMALKMQVRKLRKIPTTYDELPSCFEVKLFETFQRTRSVHAELSLEPGVYVVGLLTSGQLPPGGNLGTFIRIMGPHDADYCAWVYAQGENSRLLVGNCMPLNTLVAPDGGIVKPVTPRGGQPTQAQSASVAAAASADAARVLGLQQELADSKSYTNHLQGLLKKYQEQVESMNQAMVALHQRTAAAETASKRFDPAAAPQESWQRVSLSQRDFADVVRVTFDTIAEGRPTLDTEEAMNAVRVLVTSGFGLDEVLNKQKLLSSSNRKGISASDFQTVCNDIVKGWSVYQK